VTESTECKVCHKKYRCESFAISCEFFDREEKRQKQVKNKFELRARRGIQKALSTWNHDMEAIT